MNKEIYCEDCGTEITKEIDDKAEWIYGNHLCSCEVAQVFLKLEKENIKLKNEN